MRRRQMTHSQVLHSITRCRDVDADLSQGARHVLVVLATYLPEIRPTQEQVASAVGASRRTVNRWLSETVATGLVTRYRGGRGNATHYALASRLIAPRQRTRKPNDWSDDDDDF